MKDFRDFAAGPLRLPIGGKLYTIPPIDITTGFLLRRAVNIEDTEAFDELAGLGDEAAYRRILGSAFDEMKADGVPYEAMDRAYLTAVTDHQRGRVIAETVWELGYDPKALMATIQAGARIAKSGVALEPKTRRPDSSRRTNISPTAKRKRKRNRRAG